MGRDRRALYMWVTAEVRQPTKKKSLVPWARKNGTLPLNIFSTRIDDISVPPMAWTYGAAHSK